MAAKDTATDMAMGNDTDAAIMTLASEMSMMSVEAAATPKGMAAETPKGMSVDGDTLSSSVDSSASVLCGYMSRSTRKAFTMTMDMTDEALLELLHDSTQPAAAAEYIKEELAIRKVKLAANKIGEATHGTVPVSANKIGEDTSGTVPATAEMIVEDTSGPVPAKRNKIGEDTSGTVP